MNNINDDDTAPLERLLVKAGRRAEPPPETRDAVYVSTLVAWQQTLQVRRQKRQRLFALAASVAVATLGVLWYVNGFRQSAQIAAWSVDEGPQVHVGEMVRVDAEPGQVYRTVAGERLRVAPGSELRFAAVGRMQLQRGQIYVESAADAAAANSLVIETQVGSVRHLGTRYSVALAAGQMTISVRDGVVGVTTAIASTEVGAGLQVVMDGAGRETSRKPVDPHGPVWEWTQGLAPALQIDGRRLADVLKEIAFETGRQLDFADAEVLEECRQIELKGPFLDMAASDRLFAVLVTTGLEATESGDRIVIRRQKAGAAPSPMSD
jgi:ferric-dicitrate binding protein FerR (iron transport regulator)